MTSSLANTISSELADLDTLSLATRAYFRARAKNRLYELVMSEFQKAVEDEGLTQVKLARRMGRRADAVNRLLGSPGNWEVDTVSDLLLGIAGKELDATASSPEERPAHNSRSRDLGPSEAPKSSGLTIFARSGVEGNVDAMSSAESVRVMTYAD